MTQLLSQGTFSVEQTALFLWFLLDCSVEIACISVSRKEF